MLEKKEGKGMQIHQREIPSSLSLPLPLYETIPLADVESRDGSVFTLSVGLSEVEVDQLRALSLDETDEAIQTLTSDRKRFGEGSYESWYAKGRVPFVLTEQSSGALAALVWLGREIPHGASEDIDWHTIAYRAYPPFRGAGIMKGFSQFVLDIYAKQYPKAKIWAGINAKNEASAGLALALGFEKSDELSNSAQSVMIQK